MKFKNKPVRRRAISAKIVRQSEQHPERFKYVFEVRELDGSISEIPQYGTDMLDALSGVMLKERAESITKVVEKTPEWMIIFAWCALLGGSLTIGSQLGLDQAVVISFLSVTAILGSIGFLVKKKIDKRSIEENE